MKPTPALYDVVVGILARAQGLYPVEVCGLVFLSNHFHLLLFVPDAQRLARFMCFVNSNLAREAGRLAQWRDKFWARRYQAIVVSDEPEAQVGRLKYLLSHGCKEGLVGHPRDWPGVHAIDALLGGGPLVGRWFDRTRERALRVHGKIPIEESFATREILVVEPLPCWRQLSVDEIGLRVSCLLAEIEVEVAAQRSGRKPLGVEAIRSLDPHRAPERAKKTPAPAFHAVSQAVRRALQDAYRHFVAAFRDAAERLRSGDAMVRFPPGSFPPALPFVAANRPT